MYRIFALCFILLGWLAACAPSAEAVAVRAEDLAQTMVVETQAARPTKIVLPSATPSLTPDEPSENSIETSKDGPAATATATLEITPTLEDEISVDPSATSAPDNQKTARLRFENNSGQVVYLTLSGAFNANYAFADSFNVDVPYGDYSFAANIGQDGPYTGSFTITNADKHTLVFESDKVKILGP